jgi:hypothetical protein
MSPAESAIADRIWDEIVAAEIEERDERERVKRIAQFIFRQVADFLAAAVVKQFMDELSVGPILARFRWKERQRLVRLIARRARA